MAKIDPETIHHVARLARIALPEEEVEPQREHFARLLDLVSRLQGADLADVPPMYHPLDLVQPLRADEPGDVQAGTVVLENAPAAGGDLFLVPRVIE